MTRRSLKGRVSCQAAADDAEGGDRVEAAQLLRGEAVAGAVPAGDVEAEGEYGDGGSARVWDVEVARAYAVCDDLPDDFQALRLARPGTAGSRRARGAAPGLTRVTAAAQPG